MTPMLVGFRAREIVLTLFEKITGLTWMNSALHPTRRRGAGPTRPTRPPIAEALKQSCANHCAKWASCSGEKAIWLGPHPGVGFGSDRRMAPGTGPILCSTGLPPRPAES